MPNVDVYINLPKAGGGLDIKEPKSELLNLGFKSNLPKIGGVLDIHALKAEVYFQLLKDQK